MVVQVHRSYINQNLYEQDWNGIYNSNANSTFNTCDDNDPTLPAYHEIHNNPRDIGRTLPGYHEINNTLTSSRPIAFDEVSLPSYESAVIWSVRREEISVPIPESLNAEITTDQAQLQGSSCSIRERMKYVGVAVGFLVVCVVPMFLVIFFTILRLR